MKKVQETRTIIDISTGTILRILAVIAFIFLLIEVWQIVASVFLAIVIASALDPTLQWLEKRNIKRIVSVPIIYLMALAIVTGLFYAVIPGLFFEVQTLSATLPEKIDSFLDKNLQDSGLSGVVPNVQGVFTNFEDSLGAAGENIFSFASAVFGGVLFFIFTIVASFWLSLDKGEARRFLIAFTPPAHRGYVTNLWGRIQKRLGHWMQAQFIFAVFMGVSVFIMLTILGSPFALTLGIAAGFLEIIPFLGPLIGAFLIFALVSLDNVVLGLIAVAIYVLFQQIEQNVIVPTVMSRVVGSNPLVILVVALIGAEMLGFWGVLLAIPFVAVLGEILRDIRANAPK